MTNSNLRRVAAVYRKELATLTSYRVDMLMRLVHVGYFTLSFYFIARFVGDPESIRDLDGGYFEFVLIGSIVSNFSVIGIGSFTGLIAEEQRQGTLEAVLTTPTPIWTVLVASHFVPGLFVLAETFVLVVVGLGVFGVGIPVAGLLQAVPVLVLTAISFVPMGVLSAGFIVLVKKGDPISGPGQRLTLLLSGALYPLSVLPGWLEAVSYLVPARYGVDATRALVQTDADLGDVVDEMGILLVFIVTTVPLSIAAFRRAVNVARRAGTLGTY